VTVIVLVVVSVVLFVQLTGRERRSLVDAKSKAAAMTADLFAAGLTAPLDFDDDDGIARELDNLKSNAEITCTYVWRARLGAAKVVTRGDCGERAAPQDAELGKPRVLDDRLEVARAVKSQSGQILGRTLLVFSLARENAEFATSQRQIFFLSFALAAGTALLLIAASRRLLVRPLRQLSSAARRIGRGEYGTKIDVPSRDEMGELAHAFNAMREALADREARLEAATQNLQDLFDHMRQAILAFDVKGRVTGASSRQATTLFGAELEGRAIRDLLYGGADPHDVDAQAFGEWLSMIADVPLDGWDELEELAPKELLLKRGKKSIPLELEFRPVVKGNALDRVMLLATDVSEKRELEQAVQTQEEEHARRMAAMRRLIAGGGQVFVAFIDSARDRFKRCQEIVGDGPRTLPIAEIDELFRHVHTVKGEARAFDLRELEAECAKLEEELDELRSLARGGGFATTGSVHGALVSRFARAAEAIEKGCDVFVAASPIGRAALDQVTVQRSDIESLAAIADRGEGADLARVVERLAARPFGESTASLIDMTPTWAEKEGKKVRLDVEGREVRVPPRLARVLPGVLTHLVRNAVAHGIEPPAIRTSNGKSAGGTIHARAREVDGGVAIVVEDDGRGLDMRRIEERATALGVRFEDTSPGGRMELVFVSGLSTSESAGALAGRGVGLAAVRSDLERTGYVIRVSSSVGKGTRFEIAPS
jgi:HAMP domain-containing protein/HPt (histidine-containing phosphotransfer) domain-containing protein